MSDFSNLDKTKKLANSNNPEAGIEDDYDKATLIDDDDANLPDLNPSHMIYIPGESTLTHDGSTLIDGEEGSSSKNGGLSHSHRNHLNASLQQLKYNENKISLDRSINQTIDLIYEVTNENKERPIFYPTEIEDDANIMLNSAKAHLALVRQNSSVKTLDKAKIAKEDEEVVKDLPEFKILKIDRKSVV